MAADPIVLWHSRCRGWGKCNTSAGHAKQVNMRLNWQNIIVFVFGIGAAVLKAQSPVTAPPQTTAPAPEKNDSAYVLGLNDQITINALHAEEISGKPIQVDNTGSVNLPMVGRVKVAGLT